MVGDASLCIPGTDMAGAEGFEPSNAGVGSQCLRPDLATLPCRGHECPTLAGHPCPHYLTLHVLQVKFTYYSVIRAELSPLVSRRS